VSRIVRREVNLTETAKDNAEAEGVRRSHRNDSADCGLKRWRSDTLPLGWDSSGRSAHQRGLVDLRGVSAGFAAGMVRAGGVGNVRGPSGLRHWTLSAVHVPVVARRGCGGGVGGAGGDAGLDGHAPARRCDRGWRGGDVALRSGWDRAREGAAPGDRCGSGVRTGTVAGDAAEMQTAGFNSRSDAP
jgi:hypothetical protein